MNEKVSLYKQINQSDYYVIDFIQGVQDSSSYADDVFTQMSAVTDYVDLIALYGQIKIITLDFAYKPYLVVPLAFTDVANGVFALRQGFFNAPTPATISLGQAIELPGSILHNNMREFKYRYDIVDSPWFSSSTTNTLTSIVPKIIWYFSYNTTTTTNSNKALLHVRMAVLAKARFQ
jgi:hypothetical protein